MIGIRITLSSSRFTAKRWVDPNFPKDTAERVSDIVNVRVRNENDMSIETYKRIRKA